MFSENVTDYNKFYYNHTLAWLKAFTILKVTKWEIFIRNYYELTLLRVIDKKAVLLLLNAIDGIHTTLLGVYSSRREP